MQRILLTFIASFILFGSLITAQPTSNQTPLVVEFGYGNSVYDNIKSRQFLIFTDIPHTRGVWKNLQYKAQLNFEFITENENNTYLIGIVPILKYSFSLSELNLFIKGGLGANYVTRNIIGSRKIGGHFIFSDMISIGVNLYKSKRHTIDISYLFRHVSNARLYSSNEGFNSQYILFSFSI